MRTFTLPVNASQGTNFLFKNDVREKYIIEVPKEYVEVELIIRKIHVDLVTVKE